MKRIGKAAIALTALVVGLSGVAVAGDGAEVSKTKYKKFRTTFKQLSVDVGEGVDGRVRPKGKVGKVGFQCRGFRDIVVRTVEGKGADKVTTTVAKTTSNGAGSFGAETDQYPFPPGRYQVIAKRKDGKWNPRVRYRCKKFKSKVVTAKGG